MKKTSAKEYLCASAIDLLSRGEIDTITVGAIARNAGVSTRTFYNHFRDKLDLFLYIYTRELARFYDAHQPHLTFRPFLLRTGQILWDYQEVFEHFQKYTGQNNFRDAVYEPLLTYYIKIITDCFGDPVTEEVRDALSFWIHGMIGTVSWGYTRPTLPPFEKTSEMFMRFMPPQLRKYL